MPTNDIKPFAAAGGANVLTQAEYLALAALSTGFSSGKASSKEVNKAVRQATFIASALAQFICDKGGNDVLDDGNVAGLVTKLIVAMNKTSQPLDATLTTLAALTGSANKLPYFTGADVAALADFTGAARSLLARDSADSMLNYLGVGTAAKKMLRHLLLIAQQALSCWLAHSDLAELVPPLQTLTLLMFIRYPSVMPETLSQTRIMFISTLLGQVSILRE
ncbi:hypothetical protein ECDEC6A_2183 [Escherichia coli DEC6A]|nr:hypothetical protein [Escherichia coli]EHV59957.1 hypothetical protein ECDEC6A_2183 [Escherichia coli DEC6A]